MAKQYRQNTSYKDIGNEGEDGGEEIPVSHGNTRLPFGLCKRYGIAIGKDWTPRDAWDALKGKGITPEEVYDDVEEDGKVDEVETEKKAKDTAEEEIRAKEAEQNRKIAKDTIVEKLSSRPDFSKKYVEKVSESYDRLSDGDIAAMLKVTDVCQFREGKGEYSFRRITVPANGLRPLDKELGFDFRAETFYHESGHALDNILGGEIDKRETGRESYISPASTRPEAKRAYKEDIKLLFQRVANERKTVTVKERDRATGKMVEKTVPVVAPVNMDRIDSSFKKAFYEWLDEYSGASKILPFKGKSDFMKYTREPMNPGKPQSNDEIQSLVDQRVATNIRLGYPESEAYEMARRQYETYQANRQRDYDKYIKEAAEYREYVESGAYAKDLKTYEEYEAKRKESELAAEVGVERAGFISDFVASYTGARINPINMGQWGHSDNYHRGHEVGEETFAEYNATRMTGDTKGMEMMKEILPNTVAHYEKLYKDAGL